MAAGGKGGGGGGGLVRVRAHKALLCRYDYFRSLFCGASSWGVRDAAVDCYCKPRAIAQWIDERGWRDRGTDGRRGGRSERTGERTEKRSGRPTGADPQSTDSERMKAGLVRPATCGVCGRPGGWCEAAGRRLYSDTSSDDDEVEAGAGAAATNQKKGGGGSQARPWRGGVFCCVSAPHIRMRPTCCLSAPDLWQHRAARSTTNRHAWGLSKPRAHGTRDSSGVRCFHSELVVSDRRPRRLSRSTSQTPASMPRRSVRSCSGCTAATNPSSRQTTRWRCWPLRTGLASPTCSRCMLDECKRGGDVSLIRSTLSRLILGFGSW